MKPKTLTVEQRGVLNGKSETLLELVNGMSVEELGCFDNYQCVDLSHYLRVQTGWLKEEMYLIGTRIGHEPTQNELMDDIEIYNNSCRFRAYYTMRYPEKMIHKERLGE